MKLGRVILLSLHCVIGFCGVDHCRTRLLELGESDSAIFILLYLVYDGVEC